jgi:hypothetical protein
MTIIMYRTAMGWPVKKIKVFSSICKAYTGQRKGGNCTSQKGDLVTEGST